MGLKTSTLSLGEAVLVVTSLKGENTMKVLPFNLELAKKNTSFKGQGRMFNEAKNMHYTHVFITDCYDENPDIKRVRKELSRTWYKVLAWKPPKTYNQEDAKELREKYEMENIPSLQWVKREFEFDLEEGKKIYNVTGFLGIQQKTDQEFDGFDMYWGGRLIVRNSDCGIGANTYGLYGQILLPLNFPVNFQKTKISPKSTLARKLDSKINNEVKHVLKFAERMRDTRPKKLSQSTKKYTRAIEKLLEQALTKKLNRILKDININDEVRKKADEKNATDFGIIDVDTRPELSKEDKLEIKREILKDPPKERRKNEGFLIKKTGERVKLRHKVKPMGETKYFSAQETYRNSYLVVITNSDHPMYRIYEQSARGGKNLAFLYMEHMMSEVSRFIAVRVKEDERHWKDQIQRMFSAEDIAKLK
jgi:hypothetical protein